MPRPGRAITAFQPTRPGNVPSRTTTVRAPRAEAVSGISTRVVSKPPWPAGCVSLAAPAGRSASRRPSTVTVSRRRTSACLRVSSSASGTDRCWKVGISASSST